VNTDESRSVSRPNVRLFELPGESGEASPVSISLRSFQELGILELQHLERWISSTPDVLGEPLLIITNQFAGFDRTRERSDILALDSRGNLVVVELKRDESGSRQDLQALRYAAYSSTLTLDDLLDIYVATDDARRQVPSRTSSCGPVSGLSRATG